MIKSVGFPISHKENERRRVMLPQDIANIEHADYLYFEKGYGEVLGVLDEDYIAAGAHIVTRTEVLEKDIICDAKVGDAEYLDDLKFQTVFGWVHAVQNLDIREKLIKNKLTAYAWEDMHEDGRHVFWRNNELAGEAAVLHAFQCWGKMPSNTKVAVIGKGNTAKGAIKILNMFGANVMQYDKKNEQLFRKEISDFDVVVNCVLWDTNRKDHIIYKSDLKRMKKGAMLIDVSCDKCGGIESSIPTTIEEPTYYVDGILHYVVDHTPSLYFKTFTENNSKLIIPYLNMLMSGDVNVVLKNAEIIRNGVILDSKMLMDKS